VRVLVVCAVAAATGFFVVDLLVFSPWHRFFDLRVYRGAVSWWLDGTPLYDFVLPGTSKGFTYPPFAVLPLLWTTIGTVTTAEILLTIASAVLVVVVTWLLLRPVARRHGWSRWFSVAFAVPLVLAMEPVRETIGWGQINLFLLALVLADVAALRSGRRWAGVGMGLAAAIKVTPGLFLVYLVLSRQWRAAGVAIATFLVATLLGFALRPHDSVLFWTHELWQTGRVGDITRTSNQSLMGLLARLADPGRPDRLVWAVLAAAVVALGMWRAVRAARQGDHLTGVTLTGLVTSLISPVSWTHHLYWVIPAVVILVDVAAGTPLHAGAPPWLLARPREVARAAAAGAVVVAGVFLSSLIWYFEGATADGRDGVLGLLGENAYLLIVIALLVLLPVRADPAERSAARRSAPRRPGGWSPR
jgi:alpha-1,2-mannosyltransferase